MSYYLAKTLQGSFDEVVQKAKDSLSHEGFGVLSEIDVQATLHKKLGVDFPNYKILGACNPSLAHQALQEESRIGTLLPCNVIVRQVETNEVEVAAIDPVASMEAVRNSNIKEVAQDVRQRLQKVLDILS
jgi:uncharacterized protein (DUF302 family)